MPHVGACHFLRRRAGRYSCQILSRAGHRCHPAPLSLHDAAGAGEDSPAADDSAERGDDDTLHASTKAEDSSSSFKGKSKGAKGRGAKGKGAKGPGKGTKDRGGRTKRGRDAANMNKLKKDFPGLNIMDFENMDMEALKAQLDEMQTARDQGAALGCCCLAAVMCSAVRRAVKQAAHNVSAAHWRLQVTRDMRSSSI